MMIMWCNIYDEQEQVDHGKLDYFGKCYEFWGESAKSSNKLEWAQIII